MQPEEIAGSDVAVAEGVGGSVTVGIGEGVNVMKIGGVVVVGIVAIGTGDAATQAVNKTPIRNTFPAFNF